MGMTSDQNETLSFAEQREMRKREAARKAEEERKRPTYISLGPIILPEGRKIELLVGEDKKWYKSEWLRYERIDQKNHSPLLDVFSKEIQPLTEEEFNSYFHSKTPVKKTKKS